MGELSKLHQKQPLPPRLHLRNTSNRGVSLRTELHSPKVRQHGTAASNSQHLLLGICRNGAHFPRCCNGAVLDLPFSMRAPIKQFRSQLGKWTLKRVLIGRDSRATRSGSSNERKSPSIHHPYAFPGWQLCTGYLYILVYNAMGCISHPLHTM